MSGRGHRASLPAGGHARPEYLVADGQGGLVVRHCNREGRVREYDFAALPVAGPMQRSLAALFAARCTPDRWSAHATSGTSWLHLRQFAEFLAGSRGRRATWTNSARGWFSSGGSACQRAAAITPSGRSAACCAMTPGCRTGPVADELARRCKAPRSTVQSDSEAEFDAVTAAARRRFRAALLRIDDNVLHLQRWRDACSLRAAATG